MDGGKTITGADISDQQVIIDASRLALSDLNRHDQSRHGDGAFKRVSIASGEHPDAVNRHAPSISIGRAMAPEGIDAITSYLCKLIDGYPSQIAAITGTAGYRILLRNSPEIGALQNGIIHLIGHIEGLGEIAVWFRNEDDLLQFHLWLGRIFPNAFKFQFSFAGDIGKLVRKERLDRGCPENINEKFVFSHLPADAKAVHDFVRVFTILGK